MLSSANDCLDERLRRGRVRGDRVAGGELCDRPAGGCLIGRVDRRKRLPCRDRLVHLLAQDNADAVVDHAVLRRTAAAEAIAATEIEERTVDEDITVVFEYPYLNGIMRIVKEDNPAIISQKFEMDCEMTLRIRKGEAERLKNRLLKVETAYLKE